MELVATKTGLAIHPLDDPAEWASPAYTSPLASEEIKRLQATIDSVSGTTRDNQSICKLVWNGDRRYWKQICLDWSIDGQPREFIRRPIVLYRTVRDAMGKFLRDEFPPRWLIVTRIEPEQYIPTWDRDSKVYFPERGAYLQVKPLVPPDELYVWFMTIAQHNAFCCRRASESFAICYGDYAHPNLGIEQLKEIRRGMERAKLPENTPFDAPDRLSQKLRDTGVNNYVEQSLRQYNEQASQFIDAVPYKQLRGALEDEKLRNLATLEADIKRKQI